MFARHWENMGKKSVGNRLPAPPALDLLPLVHASAEVTQWLEHYWQRLNLPKSAAERLAVTNNRQEFAVWTGRRLNPMALGCYCYLPNASGDAADVGCGEGAELLNAGTAALTPASTRLQPALPGFAAEGSEDLADGLAGSADDAGPTYTLAADHRHLIFVEPGLLPVSAEVTVAHELIHLSDRIQGNPRKHRCHGYDAISIDEAALTQRDPELLRAQLREETARREMALRRVRPYRFIYVCPICRREYPRVKRYARPVSCGRCDQRFNLAFVLQVHELTDNDERPVGVPHDQTSLEADRTPVVAELPASE